MLDSKYVNWSMLFMSIMAGLTVWATTFCKIELLRTIYSEYMLSLVVTGLTLFIAALSIARSHREMLIKNDPDYQKVCQEIGGRKVLFKCTFPISVIASFLVVMSIVAPFFSRYSSFSDVLTASGILGIWSMMFVLLIFSIIRLELAFWDSIQKIQDKDFINNK